MASIEPWINEPEKRIHADNLYMTQLDGIIRIFKSLDEEYECVTIFQETKDDDQTASEVYERLCQGFRARLCRDIKQSQKIYISAEMPVQLELHFRSVILRFRATNNAFSLYESEKQRYCRGFYFDFKIGFDLLDLPAYERWHSEQAEYLNENPISVFWDVSEISSSPVSLWVTPTRI